MTRVNGPRAARIHSAPPPAAKGGKLLSFELKESFDPDQLRQIRHDFLGGVRLKGDPTPVGIFKVTYTTTTPDGRPTVASGLVALPDLRKGKPVPFAALERGTITQADEAPSKFPESKAANEVEGPWMATVMASLGMVATINDGLGFGVNHEPEQYLNARSEATVGADLLRAAKALAKKEGVPTRDDVAVAGYSLGGAGSVALARELLGPRKGEFNVKALAPMAGSYGPSDMVPKVLAHPGSPMTLPLIVNAVVGMNQDHPFIKKPADVFTPGGEKLAAAMASHKAPLLELMKTLPKTPSAIFTQRFLNDVVGSDGRPNPNNPFTAALKQDADVLDWDGISAKNLPVHMLRGAKDSLVTADSTQLGAKALREAGANVTTREVPGDHLVAAPRAYGETAAWFQQVMEQG